MQKRAVALAAATIVATGLLATGMAQDMAGMTEQMTPKQLYAARCAGCHGADGSKGLQGKTAEQVTTALEGYRAKTYGGAKKEIMENQAGKLTEAEVKTLAEFIPTL
jgi:cytochrome c